TLTFTLDSGASASMSGTASALVFDAGAGHTTTVDAGAQALGFGPGGSQTTSAGDLTTVNILDIVGAAGSETFTISTTGGTFPSFEVASTVESTVINTAAFTTSGGQTYNDAVVLTNDTSLTGGNITFGSTLNSDSNATPRSLALNSSGNGTTTFNNT